MQTFTWAKRRIDESSPTHSCLERTCIFFFGNRLESNDNQENKMVYVFLGAQQFVARESLATSRKYFQLHFLQGLSGAGSKSGLGVLAG
jgi:hypothetical protein